MDFESSYSDCYSYSSYSYSYSDDSHEHNAIHVDKRETQTAPSPQTTVSSEPPNKLEKEDKIISPMAISSSPHRKRLSGGHEFDFGPTSLEFLSAQTAAAVSAAISAAISHQMQQPQQQPIPVQAPQASLTQQPSQPSHIASDPAAPTESPQNSEKPPTISPAGAKNATSEDFTLSSPYRQKESLRTDPSPKALDKPNIVLFELQGRYDTLLTEFEDYKRKKERELKDLLTREVELQQEMRTHKNEIKKLEKDYSAIMAKLADREDKIYDLNITIKKLEDALQQQSHGPVSTGNNVSASTGPVAADQYRRNVDRTPMRQQIPDYTAHVAQTPYKPTDSIGQLFSNSSVEEHRQRCRAKNSGIPSRPVPDTESAAATESASKGATVTESVSVATTAAPAQSTTQTPTPVPASAEVPIMSFEEFLKQRAREAAMKEMSQREAMEKQAMDEKISQIQKQLGTLLSDTQPSEPKTEPQQQSQPQANVNDAKNVSHNRTTFSLGEMDKNNPNYKLYQTMETDYTAMCQQLTQNKDELAGLESRTGKRTHKEMMRMRFLETQIAKLDSEANKLRARMRDLEKPKKLV